MEHVKDFSEKLHARTVKFEDELHKLIAKDPFVNKHIGDVASKLGLSRAALVCCMVVIILVVIILITSISFVFALIGILYPLYRTNEALLKDDKNYKKSILCYWLIYFVIYQLERNVLALFPYISFYAFLKTGFLISCYSYQFKQSEEICFSAIKFLNQHLAEMKSLIGDGGISNSRVATDKGKLTYGVEVTIVSAELDVKEETSVICQVTAIPPASRQASGIHRWRLDRHQVPQAHCRKIFGARCGHGS